MFTLLYYASSTLDYVVQMLPCALLAGVAFFCLRPWRKARLAAQGLTSPPFREGALLLFLLFAAGLAALTLFPANFWTAGHWQGVFQGAQSVFAPVDYARQLGSIQLVPFREIALALRSRWSLFMLLGNVFMFAPGGFFPGLLGRRPRWWKALLTGFFASFFIEFIQFFVGRGSDIDDIILNTLGALIGYWLFLLLRRAAPRFTGKFLCVKVEDLHGRQTGDRSAPQGTGAGQL